MTLESVFCKREGNLVVREGLDRGSSSNSSVTLRRMDFSS